MRHILIDRAQPRQAAKRGSGVEPEDPDGLEAASPLGRCAKALPFPSPTQKSYPDGERSIESADRLARAEAPPESSQDHSHESDELEFSESMRTWKDQDIVVLDAFDLILTDAPTQAARLSRLSNIALTYSP
jgi:hypothetical protein